MAALRPFEENWQTLLAIVAHPDDLEYGGSAAIARWAGQGKAISYLLITKGEAGINSLEPAQAAIVRQNEQQAAARVVGVEQVTFLDFPDGTLEPNLQLRKALVRAIRQTKPQGIITLNFRPTWPGGRANTADHRVAGQSAIEAAQSAGNRWIFPERHSGASEPWGGVQWLAALGSPKPTHFVNVSHTIDKGVESLRAHKAYLQGLDNPNDPEEFIKKPAHELGSMVGVEYAMALEMIRL